MPPDNSVPPIPAGSDVYVTYGDGLGQIRAGDKLPPGVLCWTVPGNRKWYAAALYPHGQKTEAEVAAEVAARQEERVQRREAAAKFDEAGRVRSIAEHFRKMMEEKGGPARQPDAVRRGPPPGYGG